jgi:crossover junction endodeoxyribonuclease RuvC
MKTFIGIDPGQSGGVALIWEGEFVDKNNQVKKMPETEADLSELFLFLKEQPSPHVYIEKVHSMPAQGVASSFKFGYNFGLLIGMLAASKLPYTYVTPQKWQKAMGCMTKGDKNVSKRKAQELFPDQKITHAVADALLIAEYCRRTYR